MSRPPRTVIEYRNYELPADFPIQMLSGENWRISDVPSGVLHFHNCLEIGLCERVTADSWGSAGSSGPSGRGM